MCHDLGVCRVFKGIAVNDPGARSRTWVTSWAARDSSSLRRFGPSTAAPRSPRF